MAGLFAGIGGIELGFQSSALDVETTMLCEWWEPARAVLEARFAGVPVAPDVRSLKSLPAALDLVAAGFPCTDLSQAGMTAGIAGENSGLVAHVFRLLERRRRPVRWLVIENVANMLALGRGEAMHYLTDQLSALGYRWAYRLVDSRFTGVPQRRRRVILVASATEDPRPVLFSDDAGEPPAERYADDAFGFYRTEGLRGIGWAQDAVPTLKGGSTIGIPSEPAIWVPDNEVGRQFVMPTINDGEALQGFPRGWTEPALAAGRLGHRWKLVGNAVTVGVAHWLGDRLAAPGDGYAADEELWSGPGAWPGAAWGEGEKVWRVRISEYPRLAEYEHLRDLVDVAAAPVVSFKSIDGFRRRLFGGNLGRHPGFREAVVAHGAALDT
ncbi:MAG: DNA (cytosine-5-)-methyltransferase [Actinomycetota bacterium]|jgi:DNA (cytosine-5)-methyltransferase 1|nr:DNA (cytosine-5-)-methyltransferase [Actinomycetota bacterium]